MIALTRTTRPQTLGRRHQQQFLDMLPQIRAQARRAFRRLQLEHREEMIQEVVANAFCTFARLVHRGKASLAYSTPIANFAIRQAIAGRRVGTKLNSDDVTSSYARLVGRIRIERLDQFDDAVGQWRTALVEDRRASPADTAAARIDLATWFRSLSRRHRKIAQLLAMSESTGAVARRFGLSSARVSQIRGLLKNSWERFQSGSRPCAQSSTA